MRRIRCVLVCGWAGIGGVATAQSPLSPFPGGTPVGRPALSPVGQTVPKAAPNAGKPIGMVGPDGKPVSTQRPAGQLVDLKNLAAPITAPLPPGLSPDQPKSVFEQLYEKWRSAIGLGRPSSLATNYTPGLSRRNRERRESMWRRD